MAMSKWLDLLTRCCQDHDQDEPDHEKDQPARPIQMTSMHQAQPSGQLGMTRQAIDTFLASKLDNGEMGGLGYWQTANAYTAIVLHDSFAGERYVGREILPAIDKIEARVPHFINEFNDDTLWWAHCLLALHPFVADPSATSQPGDRSLSWLHNHLIAIWRHVAAYQLPMGRQFVDGSHDMGGAVLWTNKTDEEQVNSITTGLFAALSARLAVLLCPSTSSDPDRKAAHPYLAAAESAVKWIFSECYRADDSVVLDGVKIRSGERNDWTFTYTTAAGISALAQLSVARRLIPSWHKQRDAYNSMRQACDLARAAMAREQWVDPSTGILTEKGAYGRGSHDPLKNNDAVGFKSVLVRSLCELLTILRSSDLLVQDLVQEHTSLIPEIEAFVERQYNALQERDTNGHGQYGPWWDGPFESPTGWSQMAILDVMAGMHNVSSLKELS